MTLRDVVIAMEAAALAQPSVQMVVPNDIFALNTAKDARYGVFGWTQGEHRADVPGGLMRYAFTLFYVDRLMDGQYNRLEIQSTGVQTLANILRALDAQDIPTEGEATFQSFNQRFVDECAGVFCRVTFLVAADTTCVQEYE